jgi:pyruvate-formate lyase-activating enzyme
MSKVWCPLPWIHQFVTTTGVKMCCNSGYQESCSPSEFEHSTELQEVKNNILNDTPHSHCNGCYELESKGLNSVRQSAIRDYPLLNKDNIEHKIQYYDLRYNNLCNFSCRMCSPDFSSSIGREVTENVSLQKYYNNILPRKNLYENIAEDIKNNLSNVNRILFTGGEPLLIKDNLKILEELIAIGNTNCEILITTNCSVMNQDWLEVIKHFKRVHWTLSIDGVEKSAEYIRYGSNWPVIIKNIKSILELGHSVAMNATLSAYSVLDISRVVEFFIETKKLAKGPLELWFGTCQWPKRLNPYVLTGELSNRARQELEKSIQLLAAVTNNPEHSINDLRNILNVLNTCDEPKIVEKFAEFTKDLDLSRNQSFSQTFNLENPYV